METNATSGPLLKLVGVSKEYDLRPVLDEVNLTVRAGETYALTAPNGSGKTTLLQVMCGLTRPTRGRLTWVDKPFAAAARRHIGVVLQQGFLYGDLTGEENLRLYARLYGCPNPRSTATAWVEQAGLSDSLDLKVKEYSKGMKQRLSLARAMLHQPRLLLLDEPFDGLDAAGVRVFQRILQASVEGGTAVFLVTHHEQEAKNSTHTLTLRYGRLVEQA